MPEQTIESFESRQAIPYSDVVDKQVFINAAITRSLYLEESTKFQDEIT
jgi:hypothetical protein